LQGFLLSLEPDDSVPNVRYRLTLAGVGLAGRIALVVTVAVLAIGNSLSFSNPTLFLMIFSSLRI